MESEAADLRDGFLDLAIVCFQVVIIFALVNATTWNFNSNRTSSRFDSGLFVGTYLLGARAGDRLSL